MQSGTNSYILKSTGPLFIYSYRESSPLVTLDKSSLYLFCLYSISSCSLSTNPCNKYINIVWTNEWCRELYVKYSNKSDKPGKMWHVMRNRLQCNVMQNHWIYNEEHDNITFPVVVLFHFKSCVTHVTELCSLSAFIQRKLTYI